MIKPVSKITMKKCVGDKKYLQSLLHDRKGEGCDLLEIGGVVEGYEVVESEYGESVRFKGDFFAKNLLNDEEYQAGQCFVPRVGESLIKSAFDSRLETLLDEIGEDEEPSNISCKVGLAFRIGFEEAGTATGYEYTILPLLEQEAKPAGAMMLEEAKNKQAQLKAGE